MKLWESCVFFAPAQQKKYMYINVPNQQQEVACFMVPTMMLYEFSGRSLAPNHGDEGLLLPSYSKGL